MRVVIDGQRIGLTFKPLAAEYPYLKMARHRLTISGILLVRIIDSNELILYLTRR